MTERRIGAEALHGSLDSIKSRLQTAKDIAGLTSTLGLCHQINYSIAFKLYGDLGIPYESYTLANANKFSNKKPAIGYVGDGSLNPRNFDYPHSYLIVFGVDDAPVLVDGANDQADPAKPFLVEKLGKDDWRSIEYALGRHRHFIHQMNFTERQGLIRSADRYSKILEEIQRKGHLRDDEIELAQTQFLSETRAGLGFMLFNTNRDMLTFFMRSLGITYPTTQKIQDLLRRYLLADGFMLDLPKSELVILGMVQRLKDQGHVF